MNEITIGDKIYISSKRAAEVTGYAKDYVGQLCREGHVDAKMVGRSWYVYEPSIRAHRFGEVESHQSDKAHNDNSESPSGVAWNAPTYTAEEPQTIPEIHNSVASEGAAQANETLTDMQEAWKEWFDQKKKTLEVPELESPEVMDERNEEVELNSEPEDEELYQEIIETEEIEEEEVVVPINQAAESFYSPKIDTEEEFPHEDVAETIHIRQIPSVEIPQSVARYPEQIRYNVPQQVVEQPQEARIVSERIVTSNKGNISYPHQRSRSNAPIIAALIGISVLIVGITVIGTGLADMYVKSLGHNNPIINFIVGTRTYTR